MAGDETNKAGQYFGEGRYATLPKAELGAAFTIDGWFVWMGGPGPLLATLDGELALAYDRGGRCAYKLRGVERRTSLEVDSLRDRWIYVAFAKNGGAAVLRVDDEIVDVWQSPPAVVGIGDAVVMKFADGYAADVAYYDSRLSNARLDARWEAGKDRT